VQNFKRRRKERLSNPWRRNGTAIIHRPMLYTPLCLSVNR
jgi:hypothetical protein